MVKLSLLFKLGLLVRFFLDKLHLCAYWPFLASKGGLNSSEPWGFASGQYPSQYAPKCMIIYYWFVQITMKKAPYMRILAVGIP